MELFIYLVWILAAASGYVFIGAVIWYGIKFLREKGYSLETAVRMFIMSTIGLALTQVSNLFKK
ncbi:MAG: hypothetical protein PWP31_26 [Clostridia bacterium]|nr:hypothetical protein [Clostridia bacterium]